MKKILNQIGVKCVLKKDEMKIYGKGMIDASQKKIVVGNSRSSYCNVCFYSCNSN